MINVKFSGIVFVRANCLFIFLKVIFISIIQMIFGIRILSGGVDEGEYTFVLFERLGGRVLIQGTKTLTMNVVCDYGWELTRGLKC